MHKIKIAFMVKTILFIIPITIIIYFLHIGDVLPGFLNYKVKKEIVRVDKILNDDLNIADMPSKLGKDIWDNEYILVKESDSKIYLISKGRDKFLDLAYQDFKGYQGVPVFGDDIVFAVNISDHSEERVTLFFRPSRYQETKVLKYILDTLLGKT